MQPALKFLLLSACLLTSLTLSPSPVKAQTISCNRGMCAQNATCVNIGSGQCADANGECVNNSGSQVCSACPSNLCLDSNSHCVSGTADSTGQCTSSPLPSGSTSTGTNTGAPVTLNNIDPFLNLENTFGNFLGAISDFSVGFSPMGESLQYVRNATTGKTTAYVFQQSPGGGALGTMAMLTGSMYDNPPTSTARYLADIGSGIGIVNPAYAAGNCPSGPSTLVCGSGNGVILPILSLWQFMRNLVYLLYIVIFVVVGFMIMFRQKINPQTVISVQAALPGLIIGLILITFSYFIAALTIDLSFIGIQLVAQPFMQPGVQNGLGDIRGLAADPNLLSILGHGEGAVGNNIGNIGGAVFNLNLGGSFPMQEIITTVGGAVVGCIAGLVGGPAGCGIGAIAGGVGGGLAPGLLTLLIPAVLALALLIQFLRLFLKLVEAYIILLVSTILGPLIIMIGSMPGRGKAITDWWKSLLANSLVFPAVFGTVLFAGLILGTDPRMWQNTPPLFGGLQPGIVRIILAFGVLLALPSIPDTVRGAFGVKPLPQGQVAMAGAMAGFAATKLGFSNLTARYAAEAKAYREARDRARYTEKAPAAIGYRKFMRFFGVGPGP